MKNHGFKAFLKIVLVFSLIAIVLPVSPVFQATNTALLQQAFLPTPESPEKLGTSESDELGHFYPLLSNDSGNSNDYHKVWEAWLTKAAVHAIATSEDGDFLAVGGGYLYDNEIHIYRWNLETREYDKVWDSGDGIIKGDILSLAFGDTDNNNFMDFVAGSSDGHIYVFEQKHIYDPHTRTENQFEHVWTSPKMRPVFSVLVEDTDKDGILDVLCGTWDGKVRSYEYTRHSGYPFAEEHWIDYEEVWNSGDVISEKVTAITTADTNDNGLPELIAGTRNGSIYIFENDGTVLYVEGTPFPLTKDNSYALDSTITEYIWKPILSLDSGDTDGDNNDEIVAVAAGQGVYVIDQNGSSYQLNKLTRPLESWERGAGALAAYPLDHYIDSLVNAASVFYGWSPEPVDPIPPQIHPMNTAMAGEPDGRSSIFRPYLVDVADYGEDPWGIKPDFPDPNATWIWRIPWKEIHPIEGTPAEEFWVDREFYLASPTDLMITVTADDYYTLYVDEMLIGNGTEWESSEYYKVDVSAGSHNLRMKVGNSEEGPAGLLVSVKDPADNVLFNSQGDGEWKVTASALVDFGNDEEATGNGNTQHDLVVNFTTHGTDFSAEPNFDQLGFSISQDEATFAAIETRDLQFQTFSGGFYVFINLDPTLAENRWEYMRYLNITVKDGKYAVDSIKAETLYRPLSTVTTATIRPLVLDSQYSVSEFGGRLEAYSRGANYEASSNNIQELGKVIVGTADGRLVAFGYENASKSYIQIWDSYCEDWFNLKTNIWAIQEVTTTGKIPTWMLNETALDVPLSFKIDYPFDDYASMTHADVDLSGSLDVIVGTKQGNLTSPTSQNLETDYFSSINAFYTDCWISPSFGQLNYTGLFFGLSSTESATNAISPLGLEYDPYTMYYYYPLFWDKFELIVGYYYPSTGYGGFDYWDWPYEERISLEDMESTGGLSRALRMSSTLPEAFVADVDGDFDYDITVTNGKIYYLENIGNRTDPSFELKPYYYNDINIMSPDKVFSGPQLVNFDLDGDLDLVVAFANKPGASYYINTGTSQNPVWIETDRPFYNSEYSFRNDNFTDPAFYNAGGLYDILKVKGETLPTREIFVEAYEDTFGTSHVMSAYNNATNEIVAFVGDTRSHSRFVVGTNPLVARLEVALADGPLRNYGYHVFETWNNDADLNEWTITVQSGNVDGDAKNEVIVGDFDNNIYVFEHLTNNTYKRAFRSFDINHTVTSEASPYAWEDLEGLSGSFNRTMWDHVEHLIVDTDLDKDGRKEILAAADLSIYVFEWTGIDDEYKLTWHEDLRKSTLAQDLKDENIEKISAFSHHDDLDGNGHGEIILGAGKFVVTFESQPVALGEEHRFTRDRLDLPNGTEIKAITAADTDSDGYNEIIVGGSTQSLNGYLEVWENRQGENFKARSLTASTLMEGSSVNAIIVDDQDVDGRKELIVGHDYGIIIWESTGGVDNQYDVMEVITSSPAYPKAELTASVPWDNAEIGRREHRNNDLIQLSNGTLIQVYCKETGLKIDMGPNLPSADELRLFFRMSNDNGTTWSVEQRLTDNAEYMALPEYDINYTMVTERQPSICETGDGQIWFTWTGSLRKLQDQFPYAVSSIRIFAKGFATSWEDLTAVVPPTFPYCHSSSVWYCGQLEFDYGSGQVTYDSVAVSYINLTDGRVHNRRREIVFYLPPMPPFNPDPTIVYEWTPVAALPYIGFDQSFSFKATSIDVVAFQDGSCAVAFAGRYKNEGKIDDDIWVMAPNTTMGWKFPNRLTVESSQEGNPSITIINSNDPILVVVFESRERPPEEAVQISYSKDLGTHWSEPEPINSVGQDPASPSITARKDGGFFYSFSTTRWSKLGEQRMGKYNRRVYVWALEYGVFVGVNPSSDWTKHEIGSVHALTVGDTDLDGMREIAADNKKRAVLLEIRQANDFYQEHLQVWTSDEFPEAVTDLTIGDANGNDWPEIIVAARRGNVYSYEITATIIP